MSTFVYFILFVVAFVVVALVIEVGGPPSAP